MLTCEQCSFAPPDWTAFSEHLQASPAHADCKRCRKGFATLKSFEQHRRDAPRHNVVPAVADITNLTAQPTYHGIDAAIVRAVWQKASRMRYQRPSAGAVAKAAKTSLSLDIVAVIVEGALRLLPPDNSTEGVAARLEKEAAKRASSLAAELNFFSMVQRYHACIDESGQRQRFWELKARGETPTTEVTPDILLLHPTMIAGQACSWIEYKNSFGFKDNPFVHRSHVKPFKRYVATFGPGLAVYKLGCEQHLVSIEGVKVVREGDVIRWLHEAAH